MSIKWTCSVEEGDLLFKIADRAWERDSIRGFYYRNKMTLLMDLNACHCNGTPLRLTDMLAAADFDFFHDIVGIATNIDRETGKLSGIFSPRFARVS